MSVSTGGTPKRELDSLLDGGPEFLKRVTELKTAKKDADQALANLQIGKDAAIALQAAQRKLAEADAKLAEADKILAAAKAKADSILGNARKIVQGAIDAAEA